MAAELSGGPALKRQRAEPAAGGPSSSAPGSAAAADGGGSEADSEAGDTPLQGAPVARPGAGPAAAECEGCFARLGAATKLRLPSGEVLHDTAIIPNFCQEVLGISDSEVWDAVMGLPVHPSDAPIELSDGTQPKWIRGDHRALCYRGKPIPRHKIWLQEGFEQGMRKYRYTGWQWLLAGATYRVNAVPAVARLAARVNERLRLNSPHNHWIVTRYEDGNDCIGPHSDKIAGWAPGSCFVVIKFGAPRRFEFSQGGAPLYSEVLQPGTAVIVGISANTRVQHAVPRMPGALLSGSIVGRCIQSVVPWDRVRREIAKRRPAEPPAAPRV